MAPLPPSDECHYKVTVAFEPTKEEELFVTLESAKAFAADRLTDDLVVKCTIKKVEPDDAKEASDGERVQDIQGE